MDPAGRMPTENHPCPAHETVHRHVSRSREARVSVARGRVEARCRARDTLRNCSRKGAIETLSDSAITREALPGAESCPAAWRVAAVAPPPARRPTGPQQPSPHPAPNAGDRVMVGGGRLHRRRLGLTSLQP